MSRTPKELAYDAMIHPLMSQIIKICKDNKINMIADFALGVDPEQDQDLFCTTCLTVDETDEVGHARILRGYQVLKPQPGLFAFTITGVKQ